MWKKKKLKQLDSNNDIHVRLLSEANLLLILLYIFFFFIFLYVRQEKFFFFFF